MNADMDTGTPPQPAPPEARLVTLDILRGFALLGSVVANLPVFSRFYSLYAPFGTPGLGADRVAEWLVRTLAEASFYPVFAFLFGLGFALHLRRGEAAVPTFRRRLGVLLSIGLVHAVFVWYGDILVSYALLGFVLPAFRRRRDRTLLVWVGVTLAYTFAVYLGIAALPGEVAYPAQEQATTRSLMQTGSYPQLIAFHSRWLGLNLLNLPFGGVQILAFFLLGLLAGRRGLEGLLEAADEASPAHRRFFQKTLLVSLGLALPTAAHAFALLRGTPSPVLEAYDLALGSPALGFTYLSGLGLLLGSAAWRRRLRPLGAVGRTALSNYLAQSLFGVLLFYPYGLGLFGRVGFGWTLLLAVTVYGAQLLVSSWWLRHFRFGPAEWVWRSLTYGTPQPLRRRG